MKRIDLRVLVPLLAVLAVIAMATVAISTASRSKPTERLAPTTALEAGAVNGSATPATSQGAIAVATKAAVPAGRDRQSTSPQEAEPAEVEAPTAEPTMDTSGFVIPIHEFCAGQGKGLHGVKIQDLDHAPTVRHVSSFSPYIVLVTVEGKGTARCHGKPLSIYTPLELRTEQVLVNETGSPVMTVYQEGGTVGKDSVEILEKTKIVPGKRYLVFAGPIRNRDSTIDGGAANIYWAMPVNDQGQVLEGLPGATRAVPLTEALQIIRSAAGAESP